MSSIRKFGRILFSHTQVELAIAEVVYYGKNKAFKRLIDAIEKKVVEETLQTVTKAVSGSILQSGLSADQKAKTKKICVTSMPHVSDEDPANHSTLFGVDEGDRPLWLAHATSDSSKQQPARNTNRTNILSAS